VNGGRQRRRARWESGKLRRLIGVRLARRDRRPSKAFYQSYFVRNAVVKRGEAN